LNELDNNRIASKYGEAPASLLSFPLPFTDETVYSLISRYHLLYGGDSFSGTLHSLLGYRSTVPTSPLPNRLNTLAERLPVGYPLTALQLLELHTLFPYYQPFLTASNSERIKRAMLTSGPCRTEAWAGLLASKIHIDFSLKYCELCVKDDRERFGQPYWHRCHQLPGVIVCATHDSALRHIPRSAGQQRHALMLPPEVPESMSLVWNEADMTTTPMLRLISTMSSDLLFCGLPNISTDMMRNAYQCVLRAKGLLINGNRIRSSAIENEFEPMRRQLYQIPDFGFLAVNEPTCWITRFIRQPRAIGHPLKHITFIAWLFGGWQSFIKAASTPTIVAYTPANPIRRHKEDWTTQLPELLNRQHMTITAAAKVVGKSTTTAAVAARRMNLKFKRCPHSITPKIEKKIATRLNALLPLFCIADQLHLSLNTVYRYYRAHPEIMIKRREKLTEIHRTACRVCLLKTIRKYPNAGIKFIRSKINADYTWLYRHDRAFLRSVVSTLPQAVPDRSKQEIKRLQSDRDASSRIRQAARILSKEQSKPRRLTQQRLIEAAEVRRIVNIGLDKLPKTARVLHGYKETTLQFQKRRTLWAIRELSRLGKPLDLWRVKRLAGLSRPVSEIIEPYIHKQIRQQQNYVTPS